MSIFKGTTEPKKIYLRVNEIIHVTGVSLDKNSINLTEAGQTNQLTATVTPSNADDTSVTWSSSNTSIATVSSTGLVTCVTPGTATITVTTTDGGYTATCGVMASRLPSAYQEVEYIQSSGTQWINTNVTPTINTKSQIKFMNIESTGYSIYGFYNDNDSKDYRVFNPFGTGVYFDIGNYRIYGSNGTLNQNVVYEWEIRNMYIKNLATGTNVITGSTVSSFSANGTIALNGNQQISKNRWYYVKIWEGNTKVRDLVPCYRKSDSVIGMYDLVNNFFYTNAGSGTFTKGNNV